MIRQFNIIAFAVILISSFPFKSEVYSQAITLQAGNLKGKVKSVEYEDDKYKDTYFYDETGFLFKSYLNIPHCFYIPTVNFYYKIQDSTSSMTIKQVKYYKKYLSIPQKIMSYDTILNINDFLFFGDIIINLYEIEPTYTNQLKKIEEIIYQYFNDNKNYVYKTIKDYRNDTVYNTTTGYELSFYDKKRRNQELIYVPEIIDKGKLLFKYNKKGNEKKVTAIYSYPNSIKAVKKIKNYKYDENGNWIQRTCIDKTYDDNGKVIYKEKQIEKRKIYYYN